MTADSVMLDHQIIVFTYHKAGTTLFENILGRISRAYSIPMAKFYGMQPFAPPAPPMIMMIHALLRALPDRPFRAIRTIRDPRDIWVSGYLYHRHCDEPWCRSTDFAETPPIVFPRVPAAFHHRRERWKRDYLRSLGGRSYQQNLLHLDRDAGLAFELDRYIGAILESMREWPHCDSQILNVSMEKIFSNFDGTMRDVLRHFGFPELHMSDLLRIIWPEDVRRMTESVLSANTHIHGRSPSKWREFLNADQIAEIEHRYGDVIVKLGYELAGTGRGTA